MKTRNQKQIIDWGRAGAMNHSNTSKSVTLTTLSAMCDAYFSFIQDDKTWKGRVKYYGNMAMKALSSDISKMLSYIPSRNAVASAEARTRADIEIANPDLSDMQRLLLACKILTWYYKKYPLFREFSYEKSIKSIERFLKAAKSHDDLEGIEAAYEWVSMVESTIHKSIAGCFDEKGRILPVVNQN
jgi:hypothetical protein